MSQRYVWAYKLIDINDDYEYDDFMVWCAWEHKIDLCNNIHEVINDSSECSFVYQALATDLSSREKLQICNQVNDFIFEDVKPCRKNELTLTHEVDGEEQDFATLWVWTINLDLGIDT